MEQSIILTKFKENMEKYASNFSVDALWESIKKYAKKLGMKVVYTILKLYYITMDPNVHPADKAIIYAALGYFILPIDLVPDFIPGGLLDDTYVLTWALNQVQDKMTEENKVLAQQKLITWFGDVDLNDI